MFTDASIHEELVVLIIMSVIMSCLHFGAVKETPLKNLIGLKIENSRNTIKIKNSRNMILQIGAYMTTGKCRKTGSSCPLVKQGKITQN